MKLIIFRKENLFLFLIVFTIAAGYYGPKNFILGLILFIIACIFAYLLANKD